MEEALCSDRVLQVATPAAGGAAAGKSAYVRYVVPTPDHEEATVEYDLDEEDEQWLQQHNRQVISAFVPYQTLHICDSDCT